ncbi:hypothetical protein QSV34_05260 [Porticoccus sp. W117]|uniref:DUF4097 family beta strand repeat-containing protein n=1 Tax=Porticoccus sp. W117 TaxID=3054777 RepID=UPI002593CA64|nr:hypothetical protein [Porticoccus sp. W117]MDM3870757.1 hypothetical protein [Porticoccus sp. W117]
MKKVTVAVAMVSALLLTPAAAFAADREIKEVFEVTPGEQLLVGTDTGAITVESHPEDTVVVRVEIEGLDEDQFDVTMTYRNGVVEVIGEKESTWFEWGWGSSKVRYYLLVPEQFNVELLTSGGSIEARNLEGAVAAKTAGGSLRFDGIDGEINGKTSGGSIRIGTVSGDVAAKTSGGSISAERVEGNLNARTSGGSIKLGRVTGMAEAKTSGGSIHVDAVGTGLSAKTSGGSIKATFYQQPTEHSKLSTSAGGVTALVAADVALNIDAKGSRVRSEFALENADDSSKKSLSGTLNGGGPNLTLRTSAGNVRVLKIEPQHASAAQPLSLPMAL